MMAKSPTIGCNTCLRGADASRKMPQL